MCEYLYRPKVRIAFAYRKLLEKCGTREHAGQSVNKCGTCRSKREQMDGTLAGMLNMPGRGVFRIAERGFGVRLDVGCDL